MRILLVHDYGVPSGGAELQMFALRRHLREQGHDARLFASDAQLVPGVFEADYSCAGAKGRKQAALQTINTSAYLNLRRVLAEFRPHLVHLRMFLWQISPAILPLLRPFPAVFQAATYKCICPTGFKLLPEGSQCTDPAGLACLKHRCVTPQTWALSMVQLSLFRRWRKVFGAILALSSHMRATLEENGISPVEVIHNGVPEREARPPLPPEPVIGYAGRLSREKGIDVLLHALRLLRARIPDVRLIIAGAGPDQARLIHLAETLGIAGAVSWLGQLSRADLEQEFDRIWVQAVPSLWNEAFGNVATEASMRGTAVVCTNTGGLAEIVVHGETGLLVPPGDETALASALERLLTNRDLADRMGMEGRKRALESFTEDRCVSNLLNTYERVIAQHADA